MDKLKLKWRMFTFLLGFCALLIILLWFFQTVFLTDMYKYIRTKEIERAIVLVGQNINSANLQEVLRKLELDSEIIVMPARDFIPPKWWENGSRPRMEAIERTENFALLDGNIISLTFFAMITPVDATVSTLRIQLYIITAIMVLLAVLIAVVISRRVAKPIEDINKSAKMLANGNCTAAFNGKGFLEIKELSDTLNTAAHELSRVEALRRELMANVSHDLRTPLSLIYSYAEMMNDFPNEVTPQQTQTIMDEAKRLTSLVNDILNISQLESKNIEIHKVSYNLTKSIMSTIGRMNELIKLNEYIIDFDSSGDAKRIGVRQIISGGYVKIEVTDCGEGIPPEDIPYVWERYYKVDKKHKRPVTGTGLGLSIVRGIIEMHGGKYGVISEIGKGSTFWFELVLEPV